jgi:hypothetical protein
VEQKYDKADEEIVFQVAVFAADIFFPARLILPY